MGQGSLVMIGGSLRFQTIDVWSRIQELAGGGKSRIAVFPTASCVPLQSGMEVVHQFQELGTDAFLVPLAETDFDRDCAEVSTDAALVEQVRNAGGVFFVGGTQARITRALLTAEGADSPLLQAVRAVHDGGGVIAGTSAGAAIMSRLMCRDAPWVLGTLLNGVSLGEELDRGLGFLNPAWFVDQHFSERGRLGRALVMMHSQELKYGIGVDEDTAVVVQNGDAEVIGSRGATLIDLTQVSQDSTSRHFNLQNAIISYLDRGDRFNLQTREVVPAPVRAAGTRLDSKLDSFDPYYSGPLYCNDILGQHAAVSLMCRLLDSDTDQAIGLAFDARRAREASTRGFEFRFHRRTDSHGWCTEALGDDSYTVLNIALDIRPIQLCGPLYR